MPGSSRSSTVVCLNCKASRLESNETKPLFRQAPRGRSTTPWSRVHVNKLKLIKRQGYGKAGFSLRSLRVLHAFS